MTKPLIDTATLRASFIQNEATPWPRIQTGDFENRCTRWVDAYRDFFTEQGIPCARLSSGLHAYLAIETADAGILIFDPTFKQMYPDYADRYFLDTPEALVGYIEANGGWMQVLDDNSPRGVINARGAFSRKFTDLPAGCDTAAWHAALAPIPLQRLWAARDRAQAEWGLE